MNSTAEIKNLIQNRPIGEVQLLLAEMVKQTLSLLGNPTSLILRDEQANQVGEFTRPAIGDEVFLREAVRGAKDPKTQYVGFEEMMALLEAEKDAEGGPVFSERQSP